jgi:hypothetical protein
MGIELAGKLIERRKEAGLNSGEDVNMHIAGLLLRYLEYRSISGREASLNRATRLVEWKQLTVHLRTKFQKTLSFFSIVPVGTKTVML